MKIHIQLLSTSSHKEVDVSDDGTVRSLKDAIERKCGIPVIQMRVMFQGRSLSDDNKPLAELNIIDDSSVVVMVKLNMYNDVAGQTRIDGAAKDQYGNAVGGKFDLAKDGGFRGQQIAVIQLYSQEGFDFKYPQAALEKKGFSIKRWTHMPAVEELQLTLKRSTQMWLISSHDVQLTQPHLVVIKQFFDEGNGVYIWGDNDPWFADANKLGKFLIGAHMSGNNPGGKVVRERKVGVKGPGFEQHLVTTGLETLFEGVTIATVYQTSTPAGGKIQPLVYGSMTDLVTAVYEHDGKRCIIDGGFTRLWCNWDAAGTDRYVTNAGAWLANGERFEAYDVGKVDGFRGIAPEEMAKYRDAFMLLDKTHSGFIDQKDLNNILLSLGQETSPEELQDIVSAASDGGERISFQAFVALLGQKVEDADTEEEIMEAFKLFDKDSSGFISAKELKEVMESLGSDMRSKDAEEMLREADLAGDNKINYDEFYQIMMGQDKKLSQEEKERYEAKAEQRHGRGPKATMAHLRASQRWDALRTNVMRAVRRRRAKQETDKTEHLRGRMHKFRARHFALLIFSGLMTAVCVIVPVLLQLSFKTRNKDAQILRELSKQKVDIAYFDEALTMRARMVAGIVQEMKVKQAEDSPTVVDWSDRCGTWKPGVTGAFDSFDGSRCCGYWAEKYIVFVEKLDDAIATVEAKQKEMAERRSGSEADAVNFASEFQTSIAEANYQLIAREYIAIQSCYDLVGQTNSDFRLNKIYDGCLAVDALFDEDSTCVHNNPATSKNRFKERTIKVRTSQGRTTTDAWTQSDLVYWLEFLSAKYNNGGSLEAVGEIEVESLRNSTSNRGPLVVLYDAAAKAFPVAHLPKASQVVGSNADDTLVKDTKRVEKIHGAATDGLRGLDFDPMSYGYEVYGVVDNAASPPITYCMGTGDYYPNVGFNDLKTVCAPGSTTISGQSITVAKMTVLLSVIGNELILVDRNAKTTYETEKTNLARSILVLQDKIDQELALFDRQQWSDVLRNCIILVLCALVQGLVIFLLVIFERRGQRLEAEIRATNGRLQDLKHRDWLTSEALPVLRSTIVNDIQRSWYAQEILKASIHANNANGVFQDKKPILERTVSQEMRETAIWTMKLKKETRLRKLGELSKTFQRSVRSLIPFKRWQFKAMITAQILAVICVLIPSIFEITGNTELRITVEFRNLQNFGNEIQYYDEILTMSARMCMIFSDNRWRSRYNENEPKITIAINSVASSAHILKKFYGVDMSTISDPDASTDTANTKLVRLEGEALMHCIKPLNDSDRISSKAALFGQGYMDAKEIINTGNTDLDAAIEELVTAQRLSSDDRQTINIIVISVVLFIVFGCLIALGWFEVRLSHLQNAVAESHHQVLQYEQRDWLSTEALQKLRIGIIQDVRRATQRRYDEATDEEKAHLEVLKAPTDLSVPDLPITPSTMRYMEGQGQF